MKDIQSLARYYIKIMTEGLDNEVEQKVRRKLIKMDSRAVGRIY